ncbi:MAG: ATP-binding cassette domain-containing protein [Arcobacter butzleri]|jgi:peptide/nickel transport system ATP-binding protein|nr:ATP-binding cassette domain-containing protein [Arcobacteraceae bacterium]MDY0365617.1 ATP-binding cassette domain-containing protein [Arcobacteraceae bacterium]NLO17679.1 ATP-binding cassette domain-containing protein [Aliarcobacter butzleri]
MRTVLDIENLVFGYNKSKLIYKNFNLRLNKGEVVSIVGESGSGKSTLFELICDNLKPYSGKITKGRVATIYQDPYTSFHPTYKIIDQIKDVVEEEALKNNLDFYLDKLMMDKELLYKQSKHLSGGQLQRCSILRALLMEPELLLADEPTSALDNITTLEVMKLLISFLDKFAILLITHDNDLASWCSDKIINITDSGV